MPASGLLRKIWGTCNNRPIFRGAAKAQVSPSSTVRAPRFFDVIHMRAAYKVQIRLGEHFHRHSIPTHMPVRQTRANSRAAFCRRWMCSAGSTGSRTGTTTPSCRSYPTVAPTGSEISRSRRGCPTQYHSGAGSPPNKKAWARAFGSAWCSRSSQARQAPCMTEPPRLSRIRWVVPPLPTSTRTGGCSRRRFCPRYRRIRSA